MLAFLDPIQFTLDISSKLGVDNLRKLLLNDPVDDLAKLSWLKVTETSRT
ncbi:MAG: hypothetical protein ACLSH6_03955 [Limosilactobacillus pontis]